MGGMRFLGLPFVLVSLACAQDAPLPKHFKSLQQLTFGGQNAESYWSPDGKQIVFQATRGELKCDQIFLMNPDGSNQRMVSTGKGRTTCGYFLKDGKHILYSSTHEADAACPPPPDRSKGYYWAVYPGYDIYLAKLDGTIVKKLTDTPGYDAEGTVNFATGDIIWTSLSSGDIDVWTMKPDGSKKKQVTKTFGYDGGAVFSPDGKKIVLRSNHPSTPEEKTRYTDLVKQNLTNPMRMEVWIADADGKNAKPLTNLGCAAFAPTWTPDGKKILFSSNHHKCDGRDFDLYLINTDGTGLERVTDFGGFTGFPEFSPDGKWLLFSSSYKAKERYEFNIFKAEWR